MISHIEGANDRTMCGLPVEGSLIAIGAPTCNWCKSFQNTTSSLAQLLGSPKPFTPITLEEFEDAVGVLETARLGIEKFSLWS